MLHASGTQYNLTQIEMRQKEMIKETYLSQILRTVRTCSLSELYLTLEIKPARYVFMRRCSVF